MSEKNNIEIIPYESLTDVKISGAFYGKLQNVYFNYCSLVENQENIEISKILYGFKENDISKLNDDEITHLEAITTLITLLNQLDINFEESRKLFNLDDKKIIED